MRERVEEKRNALKLAGEGGRKNMALNLAGESGKRDREVDIDKFTESFRK